MKADLRRILRPGYRNEQGAAVCTNDSLILRVEMLCRLAGEQRLDPDAVAYDIVKVVETRTELRVTAEQVCDICKE